MNKLEMQTLEASRLARMTTTERAAHERIKREVLAARPKGSVFSVTIGDSTFKVTESSKPFDVDKLKATVDPENPRRLSIDMTVQLAGAILKTNEEIPVTFAGLSPEMKAKWREVLGGEGVHKLSGTGEVTFKPGDPFDGGELTDPFALASLPDAEVIVDRSAEGRLGSIIRRSVVGDELFDRGVNAGILAPVKRPGDGTARDYVVAEGKVVTGRDLEYHPGETVPDYVNAETLLRFANFGVITAAK